MQIPPRLLDFLSDKKVRYEIIRHAEAFTASHLAEAAHVKGRCHAKVVMLAGGGRLHMAVLPADRQIDFSRLEEILGAPVALADEEQFKTLFPDCAVGAMPPFGGLYGVPVILEKALTQDEFIVFAAGTHSDSIKMRYEDFERLAQPRLAEFAMKLHMKVP